MKNREVTIAVCAAVFGILLGSLSTHVSASVEGSVAYVPFHNAPDASEYTRRKVDEKGIPLYDNKGAIPNYPTFTGPASSAPALDMSPCAMVKRAVGKIRAVYNAVVPNTIKNTELRTRMDAAFVDALIECTEAVAASTASKSSSSAKPVVDNNCEKYAVRSIRYSQCTLFEKEGKKFPAD